ncbi:mandelate racemase [Leisingera sp. ANG-M1]|uniref:cis-3-hydroxy-L-proline dehydratase n=1 Tax=Leisingera sp. ANG-M1 TaxID=1577895 RepID=UPI00057CE1D2|nr:cis-3-hydroxy-L-proline dehydratase [Leisingera sp. ANG-M1]KIC11616.1 mandelate racemase [Leisingera sp. ANG-M1]
MKITKISLYQVSLPMKEGAYSWSNQSFAAFDSTVVRVDTDEGLYGVGEICPLGPAYLPAYAEGARTGIATMAPGLIGQDPTQPGAINRLMDQLLKGHPYVKPAVDIACYDIWGKATGQPVCNLLGGRLQEQVRLFKVVSRADPEVMAEKLISYQEQGFSQFQMKVGADPDTDIERIRKVASALQPGKKLAADANCGWRQHDAVRVVSAVSDMSLYIEQPCETYEECRVVRDHSAHPMILDECMDSLQAVLRGHQERAMDVVNLKISRMGGLTKSRTIRDVCTQLGIIMTIEDSWGGEIADAAIAHLAHSTPRNFHFQSSAFHEYATHPIASGGPVIKDGFMAMSGAPGLGVEPDWDLLGAPVATVTA